MDTRFASQSASVRYLLTLDYASGLRSGHHYDYTFSLQPEAEALPYEPFVSLLQHLGRSHTGPLTELLNDEPFPRRLKAMLQAWLDQRSCPSLEPTNPDQYRFEQRMVRHGLVRILTRLTRPKPVTLFIENAQYLPVSSCQLMRELLNRPGIALDIDLQVTPQALASWWPDAEPQREVKQSFITSALSVPSHAETSAQTIAIPDGNLSELCRWADRLYCGNELQLLSERLESQTDHAGRSFELLNDRIRAKVYLDLREDAYGLINTLKQSDWAAQTPAGIAQGYTTIIMAHLWFKDYREAYQRAQSFEKWANEHADETGALLATSLRVWTQFMTGNFRYVRADAERLESRLQQAHWLELLHLLSASYWFDTNTLAEHSSRLQRACERAIELAVAEQNLRSTSKYYHYMSVILQHQGKVQDAVRYLERAIVDARMTQCADRLHATLNGLCYLQASIGHYDVARQALLEALPLVLEEGNYEQICTTFYNATLTQFYAGDLTGTVALLDDTFTIMHLRGLPNTRFRSRFEMKALQALAHLFRGEMDIAVAHYQHVAREPVLSVEGYYFVALMDLVVRASKTTTPVMSHCQRLLKSAAQVHHSPMLELIVRKVIDQLQRANYPLLRIPDNTADAQRIAEQHQLSSSLFWFAGTRQTDMLGSLEFLAGLRRFDVISLARKESLLGYMKLENALLKLMVEMRSMAKSSASLKEFFDFCLTRLKRTVNISYLSLQIDMADGGRYQSDISETSHYVDARIPQEFRFSYSQGVGVFSILVDPGLSMYSAELQQWAKKIIEVLVSLAEELLAAQESSGLAFSDYLTGAYNRAAFERIEQHIDLSAIPNFVLCYLDLDNFKQVNDRFGHARGDQLLKGFVDLLRQHLGAEDRIYRIGGDEFVALLPRRSLSQAKTLLSRFLIAVEHSIRRESDRDSPDALPVGCSIGVLAIEDFVPQPGLIAKILAVADQLMYQAKNAGKNQLACDKLSCQQAIERFNALNH